jgi:ubiquitin C-terminal hydrolase
LRQKERTGYVKQQSDPARKHTYELYAFIVHAGKSSSLGHYYAIIRHKTKYDTWYKFDDEMVTKISD